ncbi:MAG TPA: Ig-like domain-containing protein [Meiothermus sp.]|nr:Ig-like domain-containing protein [Meiothermus sp.]
MNLRNAIAGVLLLILAACGGGAPQPTLSSIEVSPATASLEIGQTQILTALAKDPGGQPLFGVSFTWASSNPAVATVAGGTVTAVAAGQAQITASAGGKTSAPVTVSVTDNRPGFEITLSTDKLPVIQGESATLEVTVTRKNGFSGAVNLAASGLPAGATLFPVTVEAGSDKATLTVGAANDAPHSLPTPATVTGKSGGLEASKPLAVTVRGEPGALDTSFGKVLLPVGPGDDYAYAMAVQPDGKIVLAGQTGSDIAVVRLNRDGTPDPSFDRAGKAITDVGGSAVAYAVALQPDGKIVVAGSATVNGSGRDFVLVRYDPDGSLDASFDGDGKVITAFGTDSDQAYALLIQPDGKIVAGGESNQGGSGVDFALARYNPDGSLDSSFDTDGKVTTAIGLGGKRDSIYGLALQTVQGESRIVAVGGEGDFVLARYTASGGLDETFGEGGKVKGLFNSSIGAARAVVVRGNRVLVAGGIGNDFAMVRLLASGSPDAAFGTDGRVVTPVSSTNWDEARALAVNAEGKILLGGWMYEVGSSGNFALVRYSESGQLDASFGGDGTVVTPVAAPGKPDQAMAMALQPDERIPAVRVLLGGYASVSNSDFAAARFWQ